MIRLEKTGNISSDVQLKIITKYDVLGNFKFFDRKSIEKTLKKYGLNCYMTVNSTVLRSIPSILKNDRESTNNKSLIKRFILTYLKLNGFKLVSSNMGDISLKNLLSANYRSPVLVLNNNLEVVNRFNVDDIKFTKQLIKIELRNGNLVLI